MPNVVVLGSGMAGFGATYRLHAEGIMPVMYDKNGYLWRPHRVVPQRQLAFLFDVGPHISFTKDSRIQELFADSVDQQYETLPISLNNYWNGYWPQASCPTQSSRSARRHRRQGHFGFRRGTPEAQNPWSITTAIGCFLALAGHSPRIFR